MAPKSTKAILHASFLEYRAVYREPVFEAWDRLGKVTHELYQAFREWGVSLEHIFGNRAPNNASEIEVTFEIFNRKATFKVGLGAAALFVRDHSWAENKQIAEVARVGVRALQVAAGVEIDKHVLAFAVHVSSPGVSLLDLTTRFISLDALPSSDESVRAYGFSVYRDGSYVIVDRSELYADALYVRVNREFAPELSFESLAENLRIEENGILDLLGLRID